MERTLKTITLGTRDNPSVTLCPGHVTATVFNAAHRREGWISDWVRKEELHHEHWRKLKRSWKKSHFLDKKAKLVTVMHW